MLPCRHQKLNWRRWLFLPVAAGFVRTEAWVYRFTSAAADDHYRAGVWLASGRFLSAGADVPVVVAVLRRLLLVWAARRLAHVEQRFC